ncbi:MAG TPA: energy transducer TonB [Bacteroidia bacterium]|jgi:protein TonB|nr:energy transducer TonB [Bacteroidia bacterium]
MRNTILLLLFCWVTDQGSAQVSGKLVANTDTLKVRKQQAGPLAFADVMPEFPGGETALYTYLFSQIRSASFSTDSVKSGMIRVCFVIGMDGQVKDPKVIKARHGTEGFQKEIIRILMGMPSWKPGSMNGNPVDVMYNLPITIELK